MVTRQTKFGSFSSSGQERVEQTAQQAGIADGLGQLVKMGPQVLALQQSLLVGIAQSQQREAQRLAKLYGDSDARAVRASERAAQASQLKVEAEAQGTVVSRLVQTFQQDGIFHGYVHESDGTAAAGYGVKLVFSASDKKLQRASAVTDDTGYFRIDLSAANDSQPQAGAEVPRWTERLARLVTDAVAGEPPHEPAHAPAAAGQAATASAPRETTASSDVEVLSPDGRVVFEDPEPPTFDLVQSEFRYYVITDAANTSGTGTTGKKPSSG